MKIDHNRRLSKKVSPQSQNISCKEKTTQDNLICSMDIMLKNIRLLFSTIFQFRKTINQNYDQKTLLNIVQRLQNSYYLMKNDLNMQSPSLQHSLETANFRMFYFRLTKQVSYHLSNLKFAHTLLENIEKVMENQLENQSHPILYIFQFTRGRLMSELERLYKNLKDISIREEKKKQQSPQNSRKKRIKLSMRKKQILNVQFTVFLKNFQNTLYSCLNLECIEIVNLYFPSVSISNNIDFLSKKQLKRNKRVRKDITTYKNEYQQYQTKINREKQKRKTRKISVRRLRLKTDAVDNILLPSIKNPAENIQLRDLSKQPQQRKFSFEKDLKIESRENRAITREVTHLISKQFSRQNFRLKLQTLENYKKAVE